MLKAYKGDEDKLGTSEKFLYIMARIPKVPISRIPINDIYPYLSLSLSLSLTLSLSLSLSLSVCMYVCVCVCVCVFVCVCVCVCVCLIYYSSI